MNWLLWLYICLSCLAGPAGGQPCPKGDLDGNCRVDFNDLWDLAGQWLDPPQTCSGSDCGDLDGTNGVDMSDFALLAANWRQQACPIVINEFMASNSSTLEDPCEGDEFPDWIELYNASALTVDLGQMYLTDNLSSPTKWRIVPGVTIGPWGYLLIWADDDDEQGPTHTNFKLRATGEEIGLYDTNGVTLIDSVVFGEQTADISYGRYPDGSDDWRFFGTSEPGQKFNLLNVDFGANGQDVAEHFVGLGLDFSDRRPSIQFDENDGLPTGIIVTLEPNNASDYLEFGGTESGAGPLTGDKVKPDNYEGGLRLTVTGLEPNDYTLTTYHNDPGTLRADFDVYVDGGPNSTNNHQSDVYSDALAAAVATEFTLAGEDDDVVVEFLPTSPGAGGFNRVSLNGFELSNDDVKPSAPTPGEQNSGGYLGIIDDVKFSKEHGFYDGLFEVIITCETPGATIGYTTDCSWPADGGAEYTGPIDVNKTTCLRAAAFKTGWLACKTQTRTYIFLDDVLTQAKPAGFNDEIDWGMDPNVVNDPCYGGEIMKNALKAIATLSIVMEYNDVFSSESGTFLNGSQCGGNWPYEHPASLELIYPDGREGFSFNCGVQPHGALRTNPGDPRRGKKHSMDVIFKGMYGPTKLRYPLFESAPLHASLATDVFDKVVLRAGFGMSWATAGQLDKVCYTRDQWARDSQIEISGIGSHGAFFHLYLNGLYFGIHNAAEEANHRFASAYMGGADDDWFAVKASIERDCPGNIIAGDRTRFDEMVSRAEAKDLEDPNRYEEFTTFLDIDRYIEYLMVLWYNGGGDMYDNNWFGVMGTYPPGGFMWFCWDTEASWGIGGGIPPGSPAGGAWFPYYFEQSYQDTHPNDVAVSNRIAKVWRAVQENADFRMRFADRVYKHCFNNGPLTDDNSIARWNTLNDSMRDAVIAESARWGDSLIQPARTRDEHWTPAIQDVCDLMAGNVAVFISALRDYGFYPDIDPPMFNQHGGKVAAGFGLTMTNPNGSGTIYYTLEGNDPRQKVTGNAVGMAYTSPITLNQSVCVNARVFDDPNWSALKEVVFSVGPVAESLRMTEIMYHPQDTNDPNDPNTEFIELRNIGVDPINLNLVSFTDGIDITLGPLELAAGQYVVAVRNESAFMSRYPSFSGVIAGEYTSSLNNGGEQIRLEDAVGQVILDFEYEDGWRSITDGGGFSLTVIDPTNSDSNSWCEKDSWRASVHVGGSPGSDDSGILPNPGAVVINEVMAHSHGAAPDWIELHNTTAGAIDIGGWFLSDSDSNLTKYRIADGTTIDPHSYIVFYEDVNFGEANDPGCKVPFALSENGEDAVLSSYEDVNGHLTGYRQAEDFGASESNVSLGRYYKLTSDAYDFVAMDHNTPGSANAEPKVGPVVVNEIMYHPDWPAGSLYDNEKYEYIELYNMTATDVNLYDEQGNRWKFTDGIEFTFPPEANLPAHSYLLVVKDPTAFNWRWGGAVPGGVQIFGPYDAKLSNGGEKLELSKPGDVDEFGTRYDIRVDRINYSDGLHPDDCPGGVDLWPIAADGSGKSLSRLFADYYGNEVANWQASAPTPGGAN
ncbi:MAG: lamin tail domain-containing protein [Planctomycetota bacterium]